MPAEVVRPSSVRLALALVFGLVGAALAFVSIPVAVRIGAGVFAVAVFAIVLGARRVRVRVDGDEIGVKTPFRSVSGDRGDLRVESFSVGAGPSGRGEAIDVIHRDGRGVTLVLSMFSSQDQRRVVEMLRPKRRS